VVKMLFGPFLSNFVLLKSKHPLFAHLLPRCTKSTKRAHHLSVVYESHDENSLTFAAGVGYLETVKFLVIRKRVDIHTGNERALRCASENGHLDVVKFLISQGADVHANNDEALIWASDRLDVIQFLEVINERLLAKQPHV
jgi:hypothetical protein